MRKIKSFVLAVIGLLCSVSVSAHDFEVDGIYYNIISSRLMTVEVTYRGSEYNSYSDEYSGTVSIPESVTQNGNTYRVTSIGSSAFEDCSGLTSVEIGNSVTSIGSSAFYKCSCLTSVEIGNRVTRIEAWAFNGCSGLTSVEIGNSVTSIGYSAFENCDGLTSVVIPNSVISIGSSAFKGCYNLRLVLNNSNFTFKKGSSSYGYIAYYATVVCNGYEQVDDYIFTEEDGICYLRAYIGKNTELVLPANYNGGNYGIGSSAFEDCSGLTSVEIGNSVTSIGSSAFEDCSGLTSVVIPNSVTSIGSDAFFGCTGLNSLTIGTGVLSIGYDLCTPKKTIWLTNTPPSGWANLKGTINYVANELYGSSSDIKVYPYLSSIFETDGVKYVPVSPSERTCDAIDCNYDSAVEEINIGETVSYRGVAMTVKNVMPYVAYGQKTVKKLSVSHKGDVGASAFYGCTAITNATIFNKGNIGDKAFYGCTAITNATISNEGNIGTSAFEGAMTSANATINITNKGNIGGKAFYGCTAITNATISNEGWINSEAFRGCTSLASLTLGDNIPSICESAFRECSSLTEVKIPNLVTQLEPYSFAGTTALKHVELCDSLQGIGSYCFSGSGLETISIPASVKNIGNYAFYDCTKLADVVIEDRTEDLSLGRNGFNPLFADCPLDSVYIGGNITYNTSSSYGYSPFYRNTSLRSVVITDQEEEISDNEFYGCTNLKNVTVGSDVKKIGNWAFSGCSNLDYFSFGKSVETIGQEAFSDCVNLTKLISYAEVPPTCGTMALDDINKWNCVLQVPQSCLAAYQQADQWKEFFFIEDVLTAVGGVTADGVVPATADVYSTNGMLIKRNADLKNLKHELPAGIYIIGGKKVWVK